MNERSNVVNLSDDGDNDDDELVSVGEVGVLDRLHNFSKEVLKRDESAPASCRYPQYIEFLCKHIGAIEKISVSRVYSSIVRIGYGVVYRKRIDGDSDIEVVKNMIGELRASTELKDQYFAGVIDNVISFDGGLKQFRYSHNFIAETHELAENMNTSTPDMYLYYYLVGLMEIGKSSKYEHLKGDIGYIKASYELEKTDMNIKLLPSFINRFLTLKSVGVSV